MKKITLLFTLFIFAFSVNAQIQNYAINAVVNDFTVTDTHGNTHNLYSYTSQGKYVFLDFFFDTCGPCQTMAPTWNEFYDKYGCNSGDVICITINNGSDNDAEVIAFENTFGGSFNHSPAVSSDGGSGTVNNDFNPTAYPTVCLISPTNQLIENDIWPINSVATFEATFPTGFNPQPMSCTAGLDDVSNSLEFDIYPNPNNGKSFKIQIKDTLTESTIEIIDILGKTVYLNSTNSNLTSLNLDLVSGAYFVKVTSDGLRTTKKLLVK